MISSIDIRPPTIYGSADEGKNLLSNDTLRRRKRDDDDEMRVAPAGVAPAAGEPPSAAG